MSSPAFMYLGRVTAVSCQIPLHCRLRIPPHQSEHCWLRFLCLSQSDQCGLFLGLCVSVHNDTSGNNVSKRHSKEGKNTSNISFIYNFMLRNQNRIRKSKFLEELLFSQIHNKLSSFHRWI